MNDGKKALGQFFTGRRVSDLLARLASRDCAGSISTVIDPMAGCGDLLIASSNAISSARVFCGIEIDNEAGLQCKNSFPNADLLIADAFSSNAKQFLMAHEWDLVIANPPYVRKELIGSDGPNSRNMEAVRSSLMSSLVEVSNGDASPYLAACASYPNNSDLAVPAWILCAAITKPLGTLAIVVPEAWLKSNYAAPIRKMLLESFTIEYVVEDVSRSWFENAQVKTNLVIAKKKAASSSSKYCKMSIDESICTDDCIVGGLSFGNLCGYEALFSAIEQQSELSVQGARLSWRSQSELNSPMAYLGYIDGLTSCDIESCLPASLEDWGYSCGQGFRSGANSFFYFEKAVDGSYSNDLSRRWIPNGSFDKCCSSLFKPALAKQAQLTDSYIFEMSSSREAVLFVDCATAAELDSEQQESGLMQYISKAERDEVLIKGKPRLIPMLSAVRSNGGLLSSSSGKSGKYWFSLPPLRARHCPQLCIPRIVGARAVATRVICDEAYVVDANFTTIWSNSKAKPQIALALLNSTFVQAFFEENGSTMGGGALKCEAATLKKLRLPALSTELSTNLELLGKRLEQSTIGGSGDILREIDEVLIKAAFDNCDAKAVVKNLIEYCETKATGRGN